MSFWFGALTVVFALIAAAELAYRAGRRSPIRDDELARSQVTTVQASTLGLLALLLGFTLSMADSRFGGRRATVFAEAAAVETAYLVADGLPDTERVQARRLLREYVTARRAYFAGEGYEVAAATARAQAIQADLVAVASSLTRAHPDYDLFVTFATSVADVVRLEMTRDLMINARIPATIHGLVLIVAVAAVGMSGFATGLVGRRSAVILYVIPVLIALAYTLIADLDRSRAGFISTGDAPMTRVQEMMDRQPVPTASR
jgi:hypothetical protein